MSSVRAKLTDGYIGIHIPAYVQQHGVLQACVCKDMLMYLSGGYVDILMQAYVFNYMLLK